MYIVTWNNSKGVKQERQFRKLTALKSFIPVLMVILEPGVEVHIKCAQEELK